MQAEQPAQQRRVRARYSVQDRERLVREQAQSGLTKRAFCERHGINRATFYTWPRTERAVQPAPAFAEVEVSTDPPAAVEVLLPNGARVGIRHAGTRNDLVALIRGVAGC